MTKVEKLADYCTRASYGDLSQAARDQMKIRILDGIGCAIGALFSPPLRQVREHVLDFGGHTRCTLIGGAHTAPDRAAFYNGVLVRYLDFNDSYLAKGETCHPSDNLASIMAASEYAKGNGRDLLAALALAYQVQCRLSDVAPVRAKGFDHTTQGSYAVAAGVSRALGLNREQTANALAMSGASYNALRVTRTGALSNWKALAYPNMASGATYATFLALHGITGPREVFEGNKGFIEAISGPFEIDWDHEDLERVTRTIVKKYNAEIHSQSAIEAILELRTNGLSAAEVQSIEIEIFDVAYNIIGGGDEGDKQSVSTKEEADHSLPYLIAVALLDGEVMPEQYRANRIMSRDVQDLLKKVSVRSNPDYSQRFPDEMPCKIVVTLRDRRKLNIDKRDYEGFLTRPITWEQAIQKFNLLAREHTDSALRREIIQAVRAIDNLSTLELTHLLGRVSRPPQEEKATEELWLAKIIKRMSARFPFYGSSSESQNQENTV